MIRLNKYEELNERYMASYDQDYHSNINRWHDHFKKIRQFIKANIANEKNLKTLVIGVREHVDEIDETILQHVSELHLQDIDARILEKAKKYMKEKHDKDTITKKQNIAKSILDKVSTLFLSYEKNTISKKELLKTLSTISLPQGLGSNAVLYSDKFDLIINISLLDYFMMPFLIKYCHEFEDYHEEFLSALRDVNTKCALTSLHVMKEWLQDDGTLILATATSRIPPIGENKCETSLYWKMPLKQLITRSGFKIISQSSHVWEDGNHSHDYVIMCLVKSF